MGRMFTYSLSHNVRAASELDEGRIIQFAARGLPYT